MIKSNAGAKLSLLLSMIFLMLNFQTSNAAWDCRSMLAAHLKPISNDFGLSWAVEGMAAYGWMNDRNVSNGLIIAGLNYGFNSNKHQFYLEGGWKTWVNLSDNSIEKGEGKGLGQKHFGPREVFYRYDGYNTKITAGLQTMTGGEYFLIDERVLGLKFKQKIDEFSIDASLGTVGQGFARMAEFCGTRKMFNLVRGSESGERIGETNLGTIILKWTPGSGSYKEPEINESNDNANGEEEFDEFESTDEFSGFEQQSPKILKELGLIIYEEFGTGFFDYKYYWGAMASFDLPAAIGLRLQALQQYILGERTIAYFLEARRDFNWSSGANTSFEAGYLGKYDIDDKAIFTPAFSNMYLGEVMRLDARDCPILYSAIKHNFPWKSSFYLRAKYILQIEAQHINELDLEASVKLFDHIRLTGIFSRIESNPLTEVINMGRLEIRATF